MPPKPGWKTSQLWFHLAAVAVIAALAAFSPAVAGLPPLAQGIYGVVAPLAIAWLAKNYNDGRTDVTVSSIKLQAAQVLATIAAPSPVAAAAPVPPTP